MIEKLIYRNDRAQVCNFLTVKNLNEHELSYLLYDKYNCTALYYACWFGYTDIVEELIKCFYGSLNHFNQM